MAKAKYKRGVLRIELPKRHGKSRKRIRRRWAWSIRFSFHSAGESTMIDVPCDIADPRLAGTGRRRIAWASGEMPVLAEIQVRFARDRPLDGLRT